MESYHASVPKANITFLGGGKMALIFLLFATKTSRLFEIISKGGIQIIEKSSVFGPGNLEKYLTNSISKASDYIKLILNEPECLLSDFDFQNLLFERFLQDSKAGPNGNKPNSYSKLTKFEKVDFIPRLLDSCTSALFKEILETQVFSELMDYTNAEPPSSLAGFFMKLIGNCILRQIHILKEKYVFFPQEEVFQVQLLNGGEMLISAKRTVGTGHTFVLSNGALEPCLSAKKLTPENAIVSKDFMQQEGFLKVLSLLEKPDGDSSRRVVIFGEARLVMICAELLLSGPLFYDKNEGLKSPFMEKRSKKCLRCCEVCRKKASEKTLNTEPSTITKAPNYTAKNRKKKTMEEAKIPECECSCTCFGDFRPVSFSQWKKSSITIPIFKTHEVILLTTEPLSQLSKILSGSSLRLFKEITELVEKRCLLAEMRIELQEIVEKYLPTTRIFIDCMNSMRPALQLKDISGQNIRFLTTEKGHIFVDEFYRLITERGTVKNLYGMGPGFTFKGPTPFPKSLDSVYQEACAKILKNVQDSLINVEKNSQWVWFSSEEYSKSGSLKHHHNMDFDLSESEQFSLGSMDLIEFEANNLNDMGNKLKIEKGLFKQMQTKKRESGKKLDIFKK